MANADNKVNKISVIGHTGVVGSAVYKAFSDVFETVGVSLENINDYPQIKESTLIFLCVPTPMDTFGKVNMAFVYEAMTEIQKYLSKGIVIVKSTVTPETNASLAAKYSQFDFVSSPEFLTAKRPYEDFMNQDRVIIGTYKSDVFELVKSAYEKAINCQIYIHTKPIEAELIKYFANAFLALKVIYANEAKQLADTLGADWSTIAQGVGTDKRIGPSHLQVKAPGGFDGTCFPKDVSGIYHFAKENKIELSLIKATHKVNMKLRPELYSKDVLVEDI